MEGHVCAFFHDQALRQEFLDGFLTAAVESGDKCYCLLDAPYPGPETTMSASIAEAIVSGQIEFLSPAESYLAGGRFNASSMLARLEKLATRARHDEGYPGVRALGEMSWASPLRFGDLEELCTYEAGVNRLAARCPEVLLCLYDLSRFDAEAIVGILKTHPGMLAANVALPNPYFVEHLATGPRHR